MQLGDGVRDAICFFTHSLIGGELGPDDSRYSGELLFLKHPSFVYQAMSIYLFYLEVDESGRVLNHDQAEERVREFILWKHELVPPQVAFTDEELGKKS